jgi:hypothetical protein
MSRVVKQKGCMLVPGAPMVFGTGNRHPQTVRGEGNNTEGREAKCDTCHNGLRDDAKSGATDRRDGHIRRYRPTVRTPDFDSGNPGSSPGAASITTRRRDDRHTTRRRTAMDRAATLALMTGIMFGGALTVAAVILAVVISLPSPGWTWLPFIKGAIATPLILFGMFGLVMGLICWTR